MDNILEICQVWQKMFFGQKKAFDIDAGVDIVKVTVPDQKEVKRCFVFDKKADDHSSRLLEMTKFCQGVMMKN